MKKIFITIILFLSIFICDNVYAAYEVRRDETTLLAKCQYEKKLSDGEIQKIIIDITKNYSVELAYLSAYQASTSGSYHTVELQFKNFTYWHL